MRKLPAELFLPLIALFIALFVVPFLLFVLPAQGEILYFGMPNSCPVPGHKGPPCNMEKCAAMDKDGKKTGSNCSKYCAKACCLCSDACPKEQNQSQGGEEVWLRFGFGD